MESTSRTLLQKIDALDKGWVRAIAARRSRKLTRFMRAFTRTGNGSTWILAALALNLCQSLGIQALPEQTAVLRALFCPLATWAIGVLIKRIGNRPRPFQELSDVSAQVKSPANDSFPSTHAASTFSFFTALMLSGHPWALWVGAWAPLVAFSRIYLGVHYPSDAFGGIVIGAGTGYSMLIIQELIRGATL